MINADVEPVSRQRLPEWLKVKLPGGSSFVRLRAFLNEGGLHTVCEEAHCPNLGECWNSGIATFMILGDICTRSCGFCAVTTGRPNGLDFLEPQRLADTVKTMGLKHAVITSVNRDDLPDGGAFIFAQCIRKIRQQVPECRVEVLIPDFQGVWSALETVMKASPDILNHNVETVPRLYSRVRPKAIYTRSLELLRRAKEMKPEGLTKSGIMVGLGESKEEILQVMEDLRGVKCDILTIGQYLRPTPQHLPVVRFYHPDEFAELKRLGLELGFRHVESGPLVRSSYHAHEQVPQEN